MFCEMRIPAKCERARSAASRASGGDRKGDREASAAAAVSAMSHASGPNAAPIQRFMVYGSWFMVQDLWLMVDDLGCQRGNPVGLTGQRHVAFLGPECSACGRRSWCRLRFASFYQSQQN